MTAGFAGDLVKLCRRHPDARWIAALGIYVADLRQSSAAAAVQAGATHVLFLDSDMRFPETTLECLLAHDVPIVGANYVQRTMPDWWVARAQQGGGCVSSVGRSGLQAVESVGFGVMLIRCEVLAQLPQPWFHAPYDALRHVGEDVYFCQQAARFGIPARINHDLSQAVRHQGMIEYGVQSFDVGAVA